MCQRGLNPSGLLGLRRKPRWLGCARPQLGKLPMPGTHTSQANLPTRRGVLRHEDTSGGQKAGLDRRLSRLAEFPAKHGLPVFGSRLGE
jgi:hypothetical protein